MSKPKLIIIFLVVVLLIGVGIYLLLTQKAEEKKVYRVGVLCALEYFADIIDTFKEKMTELGYTEGQNIIYDIYMAPAPVGNEQALKKFVADKDDLIVPLGTEASMEAKAVTEGTGIPVVFGLAFIEETGLVESVRTPGDNITGVRFPTRECALGRLEILHQIAPQAKRIWIPYLKDYPTVAPQLKEMESEASTLNITLMGMPFVSPAEVKAYLDTLSASADIGMDAIIMIAEPYSITPEVTDLVFKFAQDHRLPIVSAYITKEDYGPIASFYPTNAKFGRLAASLADKVLKGTPAGTIAVLTADNDLRINYKYIQKLGLQVSEGLLSKAIEIVR
jgi:putative ABC transport system substrate-binding protein